MLRIISGNKCAFSEQGICLKVEKNEIWAESADQKHINNLPLPRQFALTAVKLQMFGGKTDHVWHPIRTCFFCLLSTLRCIRRYYYTVKSDDVKVLKSRWNFVKTKTTTPGNNIYTLLITFIAFTSFISSKFQTLFFPYKLSYYAGATCGFPCKKPQQVTSFWRELFASLSRVLLCACDVASCQSMSKQTNIKLKKIPIREIMIK